VPGANGTFVLITDAIKKEHKDLPIPTKSKSAKVEEVKEEPAAEVEEEAAPSVEEAATEEVAAEGQGE